MRKELKNWSMLLILAIVWGSSFMLMKRGMIDKASGDAIFGNNQVGTLRMLLAATIFLPFGLRHLSVIKDKKTFLNLMGVAFLGNFFPAFLFTFAETGISSGYAGMLNSCVPIFTIIIGAWIFRQQLLKVQVLGVILGTVGIIGLVNGVSVVDTSGQWFHVFAVICATICYASSVNIIRHNLGHLRPIQVTSVAFTLSFVPALILFFIFDVPTTVVENDHAPNALIYIGFLAIIGTALAVLIFNHLINRSSALFASSVTYFIPIVAVIIGFIDGEQISGIQVISMLVILFGVFIANAWPKIKRLKQTN
jgi:drug/metabolite transporter (DMT)-like permease